MTTCRRSLPKCARVTVRCAWCGRIKEVKYDCSTSKDYESHGICDPPCPQAIEQLGKFAFEYARED